MNKRHLLAPCPAYDVACMQTWLEDMAQDGWFLMKEGYLLGFWSFEKGTPKPTRYRFIAVPKGTNKMDDNWGDPSPEALEISAAGGWTYLEKYRDFHIYAAKDMRAPEMETDPELQARALCRVSRRSLVNLLVLILIFGPACCFCSCSL